MLQAQQQQHQQSQGPVDIMAMLQLMRQENSNFQANITSQLTHQISEQLAPVFTQVDRLTLQVEHGQTHAQFNEFADDSNVWTNPEDEGEDSGPEMNTDNVEENGFAPVRVKNRKGKGKSSIHASNALNKNGAG